MCLKLGWRLDDLSSGIDPIILEKNWVFGGGRDDESSSFKLLYYYYHYLPRLTTFFLSYSYSFLSSSSWVIHIQSYPVHR